MKMSQPFFFFIFPPFFRLLTLLVLLLLSEVSSVVLLLLKMLLPAKAIIIIKIKFQKSSPPAGRLPHFSQNMPHPPPLPPFRPLDDAAAWKPTKIQCQIFLKIKQDYFSSYCWLRNYCPQTQPH
jgi:hypothetical protein